MSVQNVRVDFACDGPKCENGWSVITEKMTHARPRLRSLGWSVDGSKDYCPNCAEKRLAHKQPEQEPTK